MRFLAILALAGGLALSGCEYVPGTDASKIKAAEKAIAEQLIDPDSAQFRGSAIVRRNTFEHVCGQVNGKNRMGGFAGFTPFIVRLENGRTGKIWVYPTNVIQISEVQSARQICESAGNKGPTCDRWHELTDELGYQNEVESLLKSSC